MVAVMVVASGLWLLGVKVVVVLLAATPAVVKEDVGETVAVKPAEGAVVTEKTMGTPAWLVLNVAVTVIGALPATKGSATGVTVDCCSSCDGVQADRRTVV